MVKKIIIDEGGKWEVYEDYRLLIEPSEEWLKKNKPLPILKEPSIEEYLIDLDFRLSMIELDLA